MTSLAFDSAITNQVKISPAAHDQLVQLVDEEDDISAVRIFVSGGGCGGMQYGMTFANEPGQLDYVMSRDGLDLYVDAVAMNFLDGVEIDFQNQGANANFVFRNVFANTGGSGVCGGCGATGGGCGGA